MSKILIVAERDGGDGVLFRTMHLIEHQEVQLHPQARGWQGEGAGLSKEDLQSILSCLGETACNVQSFSVSMVEE